MLLCLFQPYGYADTMCLKSGSAVFLSHTADMDPDSVSAVTVGLFLYQSLYLHYHNPVILS